MPEHPNVAIVREAMEAFQVGNMEKFRDITADDVVWHEIGGRTIEGIDALLETMPDADAAGLSLDVHDVVGNDDHVVALVEASVSADGEEFTYRTAELYHMSDGQITERWSMAEDTQAILSFFAGMG